MRRFWLKLICLCVFCLAGFSSEQKFLTTDKSIPLLFQLEHFFPQKPTCPTLELITRLELKKINHPRVKFYIDYFTGAGRRTFQLWLDRSGIYEDLIKGLLKEHQLPESLFYLAMIESGLNPYARSRRGAGGIWQFMPKTARRYGLRVDFWVDERRDPEKSTLGAIAYLKDLYWQFGDWALALASYNAGEGKVARAVEKYNTDDYWELIQYPGLKKETRDYLPKMIAASIIAENPRAFGFRPPVKNPLRYEKVKVGSPVDLRKVAEYTGTSLSELKRLNPALLRGITPPDSEYELKLPLGTKEKFLSAYRRLPPNKMLTYYAYKVKEGDSLWEICYRFGANLREVRELNRIYNPTRLRPGRILIIPCPKGKVALKNITSPASAKSQPTSLKNKIKVLYKVKSGDTIWEIARSAGVSIADIRRWNKVKRSIRAGDELVLYLTSSQATAFRAWAESRQKEITSSSKQAIKKTYKVQRGDTLWEIALRYGVSPEQVMIWNQLGSKAVIHPGDELIILVPKQKANKWD